MRIYISFLHVLTHFLTTSFLYAQNTSQQDEDLLRQYPTNPQFLERALSLPKNILCIDVGNTYVKLGFFDNKNQWCVLAFPSSKASTEATWASAFKTICIAHCNTMPKFEAIHVSSVKPEINVALIQAVRSSLDQEAVFLSFKNCQPLKILIDQPEILGTDMIAASLAIRHYFPNCTALVSVFGTATVVFAVNVRNEFLGANIMPGVEMSFRSLSEGTSQLQRFDAIGPTCILGKNTKDAIQSGVYYMQLGGVSLMMNLFQQQYSEIAQAPLIRIAAGGQSSLFSEESTFEITIPDLVVQGLLWMDTSSKH